MSGIVIDSHRCDRCGLCITKCPFKALSMVNDQVEVNAGCKLCRACIKVCPQQAISLQEVRQPRVDKTLYRGIMVYVEHTEAAIHPVTYELIGKARQLAAKIDQPVLALLIGHNITEAAAELQHYGVAKVIVYDDPELAYFRADIYTNAFAAAIRRYRPNTVLVGATTTGRSLAPRVAVRFNTGLTADTTVLEMRDNTDLVQIRPAFGGNIMAQILTTNSRPQFATVRYKVMDAPQCIAETTGEIIREQLPAQQLKSAIELVAVRKKPPVDDISAADIIVVAGCGIKDEKGMELVRELAGELKAMVGATRPMVEKGMADYLHQIGLSGRTVKPKLIITCGVSGAIQFVAGMDNSETIIAINSDPEAPIFKKAHYAIVGDVYAILPALINTIRKGRDHELSKTDRCQHQLAD